MRRFLNKLLRDFRSTNAARTARRAPRRASLQVEGLEERTVLSTASLTSSGTLLVTASPGTASHLQQITFQADPHKAGFLDVLDDGILLGGKPFAISSIKNVTVSVAGFDSVTVDDSNGLPFATEVNVSLSGSGISNSLNLTGSRPLSDGELEGYSAGDGAIDGSLSTLDGNTFLFSKAIGSVTDSIPSDGLLVDAFGSKVTLSGSNGVTQKLSGLSIGGAGDTLTFSNKSNVSLGMESANASVSLNATAAAAGEQSFFVALTGKGATANINATPSTVLTDVVGGGVNGSNVSKINLLANSGTVKIGGGSATTVILGEPVPTGGSVTSGIKANVSVTGVEDLSLVDNGNFITPENVTVTESTIVASGLFGNNAVELTYSDTANVVFLTGQLNETYDVGGSTLFSSHIAITDDFPKAALTVNVSVGPDSGLNLNVFHLLDLSGNGPSSLSITAPGGKFSEPTPPSGPPFFDGTVDVNFAGGLTSAIGFAGVENVTTRQ